MTRAPRSYLLPLQAGGAQERVATRWQGKHAQSFPVAPRQDPQRAAPRVTQQQRHLHIDIQRLTLPGYSTDQQQRFTQTLQSELNRLAQEQPRWPVALHARVSDLDAGRLQTGASPEDAARQLASRLFARLAGKKRDVHV